MLEIAAVVFAGLIVGQRGVARTARDLIGVVRGVTNVTFGLAEGLVNELERLVKAATDQAATAAERTKARVELAQFLKENPEAAQALREAAAAAEQDNK